MATGRGTGGTSASVAAGVENAAQSGQSGQSDVVCRGVEVPPVPSAAWQMTP